MFYYVPLMIFLTDDICSFIYTGRLIDVLLPKDLKGGKPKETLGQDKYSL